MTKELYWIQVIDRRTNKVVDIIGKEGRPLPWNRAKTKSIQVKKDLNERFFQVRMAQVHC